MIWSAGSRAVEKLEKDQMNKKDNIQNVIQIGCPLGISKFKVVRSLCEIVYEAYIVYTGI